MSKPVSPVFDCHGHPTWTAANECLRHPGWAANTRSAHRGSLTRMSLGDEKYLALTTFKRDGTPVTTAVWAAPIDDNKIGFWTSSGSGKAKRLAHTSKVIVQPCDARGRPKAGTTPTEATAELVTGPQLEGIRSRSGPSTDSCANDHQVLEQDRRDRQAQADPVRRPRRADHAPDPPALLMTADGRWCALLSRRSWSLACSSDSDTAHRRRRRHRRDATTSIATTTTSVDDHDSTDDNLFVIVIVNDIDDRRTSTSSTTTTVPPPEITETRVIGQSVQGRDITAYRMGDPERPAGAADRRDPWQRGEGLRASPS